MTAAFVRRTSAGINSLIVSLALAGAVMLGIAPPAAAAEHGVGTSEAFSADESLMTVRIEGLAAVAMYRFLWAGGVQAKQSFVPTTWVIEAPAALCFFDTLLPVNDSVTCVLAMDGRGASTKVPQAVAAPGIGVRN